MAMVGRIICCGVIILCQSTAICFSTIHVFSTPFICIGFNTVYSAMFYASVMQFNTQLTVTKRTYFVAVIDNVFCLGARVKRYQSSRLSAVKLWALVTLQTLQ